MKVSEEDVERIFKIYGYDEEYEYKDKKGRKQKRRVTGICAAGMLELASDYGMCGHNPEIVRYSDDGKIRRIVMKSTVYFDGDKVKGEYGGHVGMSTRDVQHPQYLERIAETRAMARAIQTALALTNKKIGIVWVEGEKDIDGEVRELVKEESRPQEEEDEKDWEEAKKVVDEVNDEDEDDEW